MPSSQQSIRRAADSLVREIGALDGVESVGRASIAPGTGNVGVADVTPAGSVRPVELGMYKVDTNFFATLKTSQTTRPG